MRLAASGAAATRDGRRQLAAAARLGTLRSVNARLEGELHARDDPLIQHQLEVNVLRSEKTRRGKEVEGGRL